MAQAKNAGLTGQGASLGRSGVHKSNRELGLGSEDMAASVTCRGASGTLPGSCNLKADLPPHSLDCVRACVFHGAHMEFRG